MKKRLTQEEEEDSFDQMSLQGMIMSNNVHNLQLLLQMLHKEDEKGLLKIINKCDRETGDTPLISALRVGNWDIVSLLIKYGADPMGKNHSGEIPARIKSPIRSLFISEYLNRSSNDPKKESILAVSSNVLITSLSNSFNKISNTLDSFKFSPQCLNCKSARAIVYHKDCKHLVLCQSCYKNKGENVICPSCKVQLKLDKIIITEYVVL